MSHSIQMWLTRSSFLTLMVLSGCVAGPRALQVSRVRYNEVIRQTTAEQLLLNLVRLQYRESPLFLDVASVSAQFTFSGSAAADVTIFEGPRPTGPNLLELGGQVGYEETPTVTFTPLQGEDFVKRILAPLPLEAIALLTHSGWRADRVLRLTVQEMNGLDNASRASGPTPDDAPTFEEFAEVCALLQNLRTDRFLDIRVELVDDGPPVALRAEIVTAADTIAALDRSFVARRSKDGSDIILQPRARVPIWRISDELRGSPEVARIIELMRLDPELSEYRFIVGKLPPGANKAKEINLVTRSLVGVLFYLSQAVDVPREHRDRNWVTTTLDKQGQVFDWQCVVGDLLRIHSRPTPPADAAVAVLYKGSWFYIDNSDLSSKSTMALLSQLFALQAGEAKAVTPVLTLPVGG